MSALIRKLPKTYYQTKKLVALKDDFEKYIYCKRCASIYKFHELISGVDKSFAKRQIFCKYVAFPNHPHSGKRRPCNYPLFKPYRTSAGQTIFYPKNIFCNKKIKSSLETILMRQGNFEKCQKWHSNINITHCDDLNDFYDGNIWKKFQKVKSLPFLSNSQNFAFMLNINFFQPFRHTPYSVGAIYLSLPWEERFKPENILLVGIIPGPKEPATLNFILQPLIEELLVFWKDGIELKTYSGQILARAALLCVACHSLAAREVSGFVNFNAYRGCLKCLKTFPYIADIHKPNYGGFDSDNWLKRDRKLLLSYADKWKNCCNRAEQKKLEHQYGVKYSVLFELPYFDPNRMVLIDPMHNLLLGTAKHMLNVWKETGKIKPNDMELMQEKVDSFVGPSDVGRIPLK